MRKFLNRIRLYLRRRSIQRRVEQRVAEWDGTRITEPYEQAPYWNGGEWSKPIRD